MLLLFSSACFSARANVYATDIKVDGSLQVGVAVPGVPLTVSYILNENASNVLVQIYSKTNVVGTFSSSNGVAGTNAGLNTIVWTNYNLADGVYHLSITASSAGYDEWTNITDDGTNFDVFFPTSITVDKNTNSPYYGRVFVGNGLTGSGQQEGIFKYNADGTPADEGGFSTGGYYWNGDMFLDPSPWKMAVASDDRLYVEDWAQQGLVMSFDQVLSTNYLSVLRVDNYPYPNVSLSGLCVWGESTNLQLFMADINTTNALPDPGLGIISWTLNNGVAVSNDLGTVDVTLTNGSDLTLAPYAVSVDTYGNIYTIQRVQESNPTDAISNSDPKLLSFPPLLPLLSNTLPDTNANWEIGANDPTLINCYGVAVDPTATLVGVAVRGYGGSADAFQGGGLSIFTAAQGNLITNITTDAEGDTNQEFFDVAWDNVGNLYTVYGADGFSVEGWRVYSPPGPNRATTVAIPFIQAYHALIPPQLSNPVGFGGQLNFTLTGQSNVTYVVQQSTDLTNWTSVSTNFSPLSVQTVSVSPTDAQDFYRAVAMP